MFGMVQSTAPVAKSKKVEKKQLSPEDWIREAADLLVRKSVDGIRVDVLAKQIGVTRGSFYWHFSDRDDLLQQLLLHWAEQQTEQIIARYRHQGAAPDQVVREMVALPAHGRAAARGAAVELAIRAWARSDDMARSIVDRVDAQRLKYLGECFIDLGLKPREAKSRAFVLYSFMQSEAVLIAQGTSAEKLHRRELVASLLLGSP